MRRWMFWLPKSLPVPAREALSRDHLIAVADQLRDQQHWLAAADAYRAVVSHYPDWAPIWVQLGHALKEAGNIAGAEAAYRHALAVEPRSPDGHVQLGHALKLQGRKDEAIAAYATALQIESGFGPALQELIALGYGPLAGSATGYGQAGLHDLLRMTRDIRAMLERVERMLPDIASLASIAIGQYGLFRSLYRLPPPPVAARSRHWAVLIAAHDGEIGETLASVARQSLAPSQVWLAGATQAACDLATQCGNDGFAGRVALWSTVVPAEVSEEWLLVLAKGAVLHPLALEWLDWAAANCNALAIYPDEDWAGLDAAEPVPNFKPAYDRFAEPGLYDHAVVAVRADLIEAGRDIAIADLITAAADRDGVGHLARVLATRPGPPPHPGDPALPQVNPALSGRIAIIVPTRDGVATLRPCIEALQRLAARPGDLDFVILDHQSVGSDTRAYLTQLAEAPAAAVLRVETAFNWSQLNNTGAAASRADFLLFINDDVEIQTMGWDDILRSDLAMEGIGAVGARLCYPDGSLQHGGMVFGPDDRCEHDGVGIGRIPAQIAARWVMRRQVGAVTGAFIACRAETFKAAGGFDPMLPIWFNDVDFCLRLRRDGLAILYDPSLSGLHHESRTLSIGAEDKLRRQIWDRSLAEMRRRWGQAMCVDPGFNPHFARVGRPFEALREPALALVAAQLRHTERWGLGTSV